MWACVARGDLTEPTGSHLAALAAAGVASSRPRPAQCGPPEWGLSGTLLGGAHCRAGPGPAPRGTGPQTWEEGSRAEGRLLTILALDSERGVHGSAQVTQTGNTCEAGNRAQSQSTHRMHERGAQADSHCQGAAGGCSLSTRGTSQVSSPPGPALPKASLRRNSGGRQLAVTPDST